jgi:hypothetical protein
MAGIARTMMIKSLNFLLQQRVVEVDVDRKLRVGSRELGDISQIGHPHPQINLHQPKRERIRKNQYSNKMKRKFWTEPRIIPQAIILGPIMAMSENTATSQKTPAPASACRFPSLIKSNRTDLTNTDTKQDRMREECTVFESTD